MEGARAAYQRAIDSGHPDAAPKAMVNLGVLLAEQGDVEGARAAYQRAIDTGHPDAGADGDGQPGGAAEPSRAMSRALGPPTSGPSTPATPSRRRRR